MNPRAPSLPRRAAAALLAAGLALGGPGARGAGAAEPRVVLVEMFGSARCADCPAARSALRALEVELAGRVAAVEYLTAGPLASAASRARADEYGVTLLPTVRFDGVVERAGPSDFPAAYGAALAARLALASPLSVEALFFFERESRLGSVAVSAAVAPGAAIPDPGGAWIRILLTEDGVPACCGAGGASSWDRVARDLLAPIPLAVAAAGETQSLEANFALDPDWDVDRLGGVVFVQRGATGEVLGAVRGRVSSALEPVPVSFFDASRASLFPAHPNPMRAKTRIDFFLPRPGPARLRILNGAGRVVRVLTDGPRTAGLHPMSWNATDAAGRPVASGVYFILLETPTGALSRRLALVR